MNFATTTPNAQNSNKKAIDYGFLHPLCGHPSTTKEVHSVGAQVFYKVTLIL